MVSMATHYAILESSTVLIKNAHITAATHSRILNFVPNKLVDRELLYDGQKCKLSNFLINEY